MNYVGVGEIMGIKIKGGDEALDKWDGEVIVIIKGEIRMSEWSLR